MAWDLHTGITLPLPYQRGQTRHLKGYT